MIEDHDLPKQPLSRTIDNCVYATLSVSICQTQETHKRQESLQSSYYSKTETKKIWFFVKHFQGI